MVRTAIPFGLGARLVSAYQAELSDNATSARSRAAPISKCAGQPCGNHACVNYLGVAGPWWA